MLLSAHYNSQSLDVLKHALSQRGKRGARLPFIFFSLRGWTRSAGGGVVLLDWAASSRQREAMQRTLKLHRGTAVWKELSSRRYNVSPSHTILVAVLKN